MSAPGTPTPTKRSRTLVRMPTPGDHVGHFHEGWIIYDGEDNEQLAIPVGPPLSVARHQALQITPNTTKWFRKIAFGKATHDAHGRDAVLILIGILVRRAKVACRAQPSAKALTAAAMPSGGNLGGAAKLDLDSSDSDKEQNRPRDGSDTARRVPPNIWATFARLATRTVSTLDSLPMACVRWSMLFDSSAVSCLVALKKRASSQLIVIGLLGRTRVIPSRCTLS